MSDPQDEHGYPEPSGGHPRRKTVRRTTPAGEWQRKPDGLRVRVVEVEELTTDEWRRRFAGNLDRLLGLIGVGRKAAAEEMGVPYQTVRRLVSAGVSRTDERSARDLAKIAAYFALADVGDLWRADLVRAVLDPVQGRTFIARFRTRLAAERDRRLAEQSVPTHDELALLNRALGFEAAPSLPLAAPEAVKVSAILASAKGATFRRLIDDYYDLTRRPGCGPDETGAGNRPAAGG